MAEPTGEYKLDMSLPYSRMLASELLYLSEAKKGHEVGGICFAMTVAAAAYFPFIIRHVIANLGAATHIYAYYDTINQSWRYFAPYFEVWGNFTIFVFVFVILHYNSG